MQIIVLGMHRSGTSVITRIINMMGAYFGPAHLSLGTGPDNPKGFWERRDILSINQHLLNHFGCVWYKVDRWDDNRLNTIPSQLAHGTKTVLQELNAHQPWVMKDPRLCITFSYWKKFLLNPIAVIAWRDPLEIARSLQLRNDIPIEYGMALWEYHAVHTIRHSANLPRVFVRHEDMMTAPIQTTETLHKALLAKGVKNLTMPFQQEIGAFIEPSLHRALGAEVAYTLTPLQQKISAMLRNELPFDASLEVSPESKHIMNNMIVSGAPVAKKPHA